MQKLIYVPPLTLITLITAACDETLNESELYVFDKNLADKGRLFRWLRRIKEKQTKIILT